jgi:hypothetical protein
MNLTLSYIRKAIKGDKRFDQNIDLIDDGDQAAVWLTDGWTWCANDGNRHVEHFTLAGDYNEIDSVDYWKKAVSMIEKEI